MKKRKSTADHLGDYREQLARHYKSLRTGIRMKFSPSRSAFPPEIRSLLNIIDAEELQKHEKMLQQMKDAQQHHDK